MNVTDGIAKIKINGNGRIVIPQELRAAMGVKPGDEVMMRVQGGELRIYTLAQALATLQRALQRHAKPGVSVVDEFIAERRAEAQRDAAAPRPRARAQRAR